MTTPKFDPAAWKIPAPHAWGVDWLDGMDDIGEMSAVDVAFGVAVEVTRPAIEAAIEASKEGKECQT